MCCNKKYSSPFLPLLFSAIVRVLCFCFCLRSLRFRLFCLSAIDDTPLFLFVRFFVPLSNRFASGCSETDTKGKRQYVIAKEVETNTTKLCEKKNYSENQLSCQLSIIRLNYNLDIVNFPLFMNTHTQHFNHVVLYEMSLYNQFTNCLLASIWFWLTGGDNKSSKCIYEKVLIYLF